MQFKYTGDPRDGSGPQVMTAFGIRFERDRPTEVDESKFPQACQKLRNNSHFEEVEDKPKAASKRSASNAASGLSNGSH